MPHAVSMASPGLQALILCGPGSSFPTFTSNPDENPKALLPIANRPMVWYPLDFCYRMGVTDITLVCPPSAQSTLQNALHINPFLTSLPIPRPQILAPKDLEYTTGTAGILRLPEVKAVVAMDFLVLPCDLVCELGGEALLKAWMVKAVDLGHLLESGRGCGRPCGGLGVYYETKTATPVKGEETDFVAIMPPGPAEKNTFSRHVSSLLYSMPSDSLKDKLEEAEEGLATLQAMIRTFPQTRLMTTHRDAHIYIFPRWILRLVEENEDLDTIAEDIVGGWAKAVWQEGLATRLGYDKALKSNSDKSRQADEFFEDSDVLSELDPNERPLSPSQRQRLQTVTRGDKQDAIDLPKPDLDKASKVPPMLAYVHPCTSTRIIRRVDTAQLLLQTSLQLAKLPSLDEGSLSPFAHARKIAYPEGVQPRTTITQRDTLVGDNVTVSEKSAIKDSVVGANCTLHEGAKLSQCLLMDGVTVGKSCKLTKCVLGRHCVIGDGCVLTDCEVQEKLLVEAKTEAKGEQLMSSSGLEDAVQGMDLEGDGDQDGPTRYEDWHPASEMWQGSLASTVAGKLVDL